MAQELVPGDILFYQGRWDSPLDLAIMARTHSQVVHVGIVVNQGVEPMTVAAQSAGIVAADSGNWKWLAKVGYEDGRLAEAIAWIATKIGQPYGAADLLNQLLLLTGKEPVLLDKSFDCSDLACSFLWVGGAQLDGWMIEHNRVTPADLFNYFQAHALIEERENG